MKFRTAWAAALAAASLCLPCAAAPGDYALKARFPLGGEGGWDYLSYDAASHRLFIARATRVQVVNPDDGTLLGEIADTAGVHGVALAGDFGKGYTSNGRDNSVGVFDLKSLRPLAKIKTVGGENPDFIVYDAVSKRVFAFNGRSHNPSVIDAATDTLVATIALDGKPEAAVADGRGGVFVNIEDRNEISSINAAEAKLVATWALKGCDEPAGLAMDAAARRLFVGCHNRTLLVVDADSGAPVRSLPIGDGVDANAFDAVTKQVFSSQGDGTLTVIQQGPGDHYGPVQTARTQTGARTMALNPVSHEIYLVSADFDMAPAASAASQPRRTMKAGSFTLLVMSPSTR